MLVAVIEVRSQLSDDDSQAGNIVLAPRDSDRQGRDLVDHLWIVVESVLVGLSITLIRQLQGHFEGVTYRLAWDRSSFEPQRAHPLDGQLFSSARGIVICRVLGVDVVNRFPVNIRWYPGSLLIPHSAFALGSM